MRKWIFALTVSFLMVALLSACGAFPALSKLGTAVVNSSPGISASGDPGTSQNAPSVAANSQAPQPTAQSTSPIRSLAVTGTGRATLTPDIAYVNIGVQTQGEDVAEPLARNKTLTQQVVDAIKSFGVDDKDIQTSNFNIYPQQQYGPTGEILSTKYVIDNIVSVTVRDLNKLGDMLDAAVKAGANNINNIQFDVADRTAALADARKAAVDNAKSQATQLAQDAGVQLLDIQSINTATQNVPLPYYMGYGMGGGGAAPAQAPSVPVQPGQLIISVDVSIVYQIQ